MDLLLLIVVELRQGSDRPGVVERDLLGHVVGNRLLHVDQRAQLLPAVLKYGHGIFTLPCATTNGTANTMLSTLAST